MYLQGKKKLKAPTSLKWKLFIKFNIRFIYYLCKEICNSYLFILIHFPVNKFTKKASSRWSLDLSAKTFCSIRKNEYTAYKILFFFKSLSGNIYIFIIINHSNL